MKKSKTRIFINKEISANLLIYIKSKQHHFLKNVLRVNIDEEVNIFDGISGEWKSTIISINRDTIVLKVKKNIKKMKFANDFWLIFAPIKQQRMSLAIQKATELGVSKIVPCITEFTNVRKVNIKNLKDNAIEAAEQSERLDIPIIEKEIKLDELFANWPKNRKIIYCDEKNLEGTLINDSLIKYKDTDNKWAVLVGPEGGFSDIEKQFIIKHKNVLPVSLGNTLLRSDTAIIVSLFSIQQLLF